MDVVVHEIRQSRDRIKTLSYSCDVEVTDNLPTPFKAIETVTEKGQWRRVWIDRISQFSKAPGSDFVSRCVLSQTYTASWIVGTAPAEQYFHKFPSNLASDEEREYQGDLVELYGFGMGDEDLETLQAETKPEEWSVKTVKHKAGEVVIELTVDYPKIGPTIVVIDPNKGHLIRNVTSYALDHSVRGVISIDAQHVAGNIWFPMRVEETSFDHGRVTRHLVLSVRNLEINQPVDDILFSIEALDLPDGMVLEQHRTDGSVAEYVMRKGEPVPGNDDLTWPPEASREKQHPATQPAPR